MNYLLDTCVLSEFTRRQPNPGVVNWVATADESQLFLSAISIGEIKHGIDRMPDSVRKQTLNTWFDDQLNQRFVGRIISIDADIMLAWGSLTVRLESLGKPMPAFDSLIAATAVHHNLVLVTRNEVDFENTGILIVNPWI
jgi:toxin FitB